MYEIQVTKLAYATVLGAVQEVRPGQRYHGRDVTPRHNPFRKIVLETEQGLISFNIEDVAVRPL